MDVTREQIEQRKAILQNDLQQAQANLYAIQGAIQDCDYWLAQLEAQPVQEDAKGS